MKKIYFFIKKLKIIKTTEKVLIDLLYKSFDKIKNTGKTLCFAR